MICKRVNLTFLSGTTSSVVISHKLSRALLANAVMLYGEEIVEKVQKFPFAVTDLLPIVKNTKNNKEVYLLPKPLLPFSAFKGKEQSQFKQFKKASYITEEAFIEVLKAYEKNEQLQESLDVTDGIIKHKKLELEYRLLSDSRPHNALLRSVPVSNPESKKETDDEIASNQFFYSEQFISQMSRYYFLIATEHEETMTIILNALKLLADNGLGGDISVGAGNFRIDKIQESNDCCKGKSKNKILLSSWLPSEDDLKKEKIAIPYYRLLHYQPISRFKESYPITLKPTRFIGSGSIIVSNFTGQIIGKHHEIGIQNERSLAWGYAITLGVDI